MNIIGRSFKWIRTHYYNIVHSIAFMPALIAVGFLILSVIMLEIDFSEFGKHIKAYAKWISLKDAVTARSIVSTIAAGIISLLVFSFSMVMILLNEAASKMSNRILSSLIGNRFQQIVLGFYVGTIVYAMFILSTIRSIDSGIYVPALSIYLLILLTIIDIFFFIYFLHYVTQSIKYEVIISRIHSETLASLQKYCVSTFKDEGRVYDGVIVGALSSGYYQRVNKKELLEYCSDKNLSVTIIPLRGDYILKGMPLFAIEGKENITEAMQQECLVFIDLFEGQPISTNPYNGFHQLKEIAVKALSPGINDPGTALISLQALTDLLAFRLFNYPVTKYKDTQGVPRVYIHEISFENLFKDCYLPIWDYAKNDRIIMTAMKDLLDQIQTKAKDAEAKFVIREMQERVVKCLNNIEDSA